MRQTQYNKLITLASKFDSKWIKKAIKANKVRNTVSPNESQVLKTLSSSINKSHRNPILSANSSEIINVENIKLNNSKFETNKGSSITIPRRKFARSALEAAPPIDYKNSFEANKNEALTPYDIRILKEQILKESSSVKAKDDHVLPKVMTTNINELMKPRVLPKTKQSYFTKLNLNPSENISVGQRLSPRMTEFYHMNKRTIMSIMDESDRRKSEISKYPGFRTLEHNSFNTNVKNNNRFDLSNSQAQYVEYSSDEEGNNTANQKILNTFHFNVDLSNNEVKLRKELKRLHKENRSHMVSRENVSFKLPSTINNTRKQLTKINLHK